MDRLKAVPGGGGGLGHETLILCDNDGQVQRLEEILGEEKSLRERAWESEPWPAVSSSTPRAPPSGSSPTTRSSGGPGGSGGAGSSGGPRRWRAWLSSPRGTTWSIWIMVSGSSGAWSIWRSAGRRSKPWPSSTPAGRSSGSRSTGGPHRAMGRRGGGGIPTSDPPDRRQEVEDPQGEDGAGHRER